MLINLLNKTANWKFILIFFLLNAFFTGYLFNNAGQALNQLAGQEVEMLDLRHNYTLEEVNIFFTAIKEEGRQIYYDVIAVTDMIFPFVYGPFFIFILAFFIKKISTPSSKWLYLSLFPVLIMILDYAENLNTLQLLDSFPNLTAVAVEKGSNLTSIKHLLIEVSILGILLSFLGWIGKLLFRKFKA